MSQEATPHYSPPEPQHFDRIPAESHDGLCEILESEGVISVIDSRVGVTVSFTPPGEFVQGVMRRDKATLGCVAALTFRLHEREVLVKCIGGTVVIPRSLEYQLIDEFPENPPAQPGTILISVVATAAAQSNASASSGGTLTSCCKVVPPCHTGVATFVERGLAFVDQPLILATGGFIVIQRLVCAEEVKSVYYTSSQCGQGVQRRVQIEYIPDPPFSGQPIRSFIPLSCL